MHYVRQRMAAIRSEENAAAHPEEIALLRRFFRRSLENFLSAEARLTPKKGEMRFRICNGHCFLFAACQRVS